MYFIPECSEQSTVAHITAAGLITTFARWSWQLQPSLQPWWWSWRRPSNSWLLEGMDCRHYVYLTDQKLEKSKNLVWPFEQPVMKITGCSCMKWGKGFVVTNIDTYCQLVTWGSSLCVPVSLCLCVPVSPLLIICNCRSNIYDTPYHYYQPIRQLVWSSVG